MNENGNILGKLFPTQNDLMKHLAEFGTQKKNKKNFMVDFIILIYLYIKKKLCRKKYESK